MFRRGGSTGGGITSGLQRTGFATGSTRDRLMKAVGQQPSRQNFNDFLINFGLNMAGNAPTGNIFQTAATQAKEPYGQFAKANQAEQNLLRQVGLEAETLDIGSEQKTAAAAAKDASSMARLKTKIASDERIAASALTDNLDALISARAQESIAENKFNNYTAATNEATWVYIGSKEYKDRTIGGTLTEKRSNDAKAQAKFAKNQGKKNGVGKIYYDPYKDQVLEIVYDSVEREYSLKPVGGGTEVVDTTEVVEEKTPYEKITGKESKPYSYKDYQKSTDETTQKIIDTVTIPVDLQDIDTSNIRKYR